MAGGIIIEDVHHLVHKRHVSSQEPRHQYVVETDERALQLRNNLVFVIARIADQGRAARWRLIVVADTA